MDAELVRQRIRFLVEFGELAGCPRPRVQVDRRLLGALLVLNFAGLFLLTL